MKSCIIDVMEGQDVAATEIPVDFLQTNYDKGYIHIKN